MITWEECVERGIIQKIGSNPEIANKMFAMASLRLEFLDRDMEEKYTSLKIEAYYDIIKELIFANLYREGYNCSNHICLIAYSKIRFDFFKEEIRVINNIRKLRNDISYRGENISNGFLIQNEVKFKKIIKKLSETFINSNLIN